MADLKVKFTSLEHNISAEAILDRDKVEEFDTLKVYEDKEEFVVVYKLGNRWLKLSHDGIVMNFMVKKDCDVLVSALNEALKKGKQDDS